MIIKPELTECGLWIVMIVVTIISMLAVFSPNEIWWKQQTLLKSQKYSVALASEMATFTSQLAKVNMMLAAESDPIIKADLKRHRIMLMQQGVIARTKLY